VHVEYFIDELIDQICIEHCPQEYWTWHSLATQEEMLQDNSLDWDGRSKMICLPHVDKFNASKVPAHLSSVAVGHGSI
jgi:hypothetical protein